MRAQMEMRSVLLETGGKGISWKLTELCSAVMWKAKLANDEFRCLAETFKQGVKCVAWFLLALIAKCERKIGWGKKY